MKEEKIILDVGSSTVKVYRVANNKLKHIQNKSIFFKEGFTSDFGISEKNKKLLIDFLKQTKEDNQDALIEIYATSMFRKMSTRAQQQLVDDIFESTGLYFGIIPHDLESFYMQQALVGKYNNELALIINIGGGSTELIVMKGRDVLKTHELENLGVGTLITKYPEINNPVSGVGLTDLVKEIKEILPDIDQKVETAFYSGGELTYMKLADYTLTKNNLFQDGSHPNLISFTNFKKNNNDIFKKITLNELEKLMPENPKWMHGARACSAIAQAICEKYSIKNIIPSDSNLVDGIARRSFRKVVISGSFRKFLKEILEVKKELAQKGVEILSPRFTEPKNPGEEFVVFEGEEGESPLVSERHHINSIEQADALIVVNPKGYKGIKKGYVGASSLIKIGYAHALRKKIIFTEIPEEFMLNTLPAQFGL